MSEEEEPTTVLDANNKNKSRFQVWKEKLITHEDAYHSHKILGVLVLAIIIWRFAMVLVDFDSDMGFESHPNWTFPTLLVHIALNLSSLQFKIPKQRIKDGGRIWPEYRLHAMTFATRSIVTIALYTIEKQWQLTPNYDWNYVIVVGGMAAADMASWSVGQRYQSRSVRDLDVHPATKFFFSFMQFNANAGILYGVRKCSLPFLIIFVTQTTPFVATLRRKNMFYGGAAIYGGMLLFSFLIMHFTYMRAGSKTVFLVRTIGQVAALQRMTPLPSALAPVQNKYVVWTTMFLVSRYLRAHLDDFPVDHFKFLWAGSMAACIVMGFFKVQKALHSQTKIKKV